MFPSWSWAGWDGSIRMDEQDVRVPEDCEIELLHHNGRAEPLQDWLDKALDKATQQNPGVADAAFHPRVLRVKAPTVRLSFRHVSWGYLNKDPAKNARFRGSDVVDGLQAILPIRRGVTAMAYACLEEEMPLDASASGLVLRSQDASSRRSYAMLLLAPDDDGQHYRRIGFVGVSPRQPAPAAGEEGP
ncbi:hypothetical protein VTI74DRAFT_2952 [Chaetomium olivicolor]